MPKEQLKVILDFDGTLTDEDKQAKELATVAKHMLAEDILPISQDEIDQLYSHAKEEILKNPHLFPWVVNGMPTSYAYEGAYLLNTVVLQQVLSSSPHFLKTIESRFPSDKFDSVTKCLNYIFHEGSLHIKPHFLNGAKEFLISLIENDLIDPVILTNSETRKINKNLSDLEIGEAGTKHPFSYGVSILGDTRQYYIDPKWNTFFNDPTHGKIQILPVTQLFSIDLRRPIYHEALSKIIAKGYKEIVVAADGFSLAGALPLMMNMNFILLATDYTPTWSKDYVASHPRGSVVKNLEELGGGIRSLI